MNGNNKSSGSAPWKLLTLAAVLLAVLVAVFVLVRGGEKSPEGPADSTAGTEACDYTFTPEEEGVTAFTLENGLAVRRYGSYIGVYMEDGSDEFVRDTMMIVVENTGDRAIQYAKIFLSGEAGEAQFALTTLKPGDSMVVLEANRKSYGPGDVYTQARAENVAFFTEERTLEEDRLEIQPLEGGFNIRNISGADIGGEIAVYFKDVAGDMFYGGITYVCRIKEGLKDGEIRQIMSSNFTASGSEVVFVRISE